MTIEIRKLPLFPLHTVLFPGSTIPLNIFEDRYKEMINDCREADSMFGVVLIKEGEEVGGPSIPHRVGTVAKITNMREVSGGRIYISALGTERFQIAEIEQDTPYLIAAVEVGEPDDNPYIPAARNRSDERGSRNVARVVGSECSGVRPRSEADRYLLGWEEIDVKILEGDGPVCKLV